MPSNLRPTYKRFDLKGAILNELKAWPRGRWVPCRVIARNLNRTDTTIAQSAQKLRVASLPLSAPTTYASGRPRVIRSDSAWTTTVGE